MKKTILFMAVILTTCFSYALAASHLDEDFSERAIGERLAPVGRIVLAEVKVVRAGPRTGPELYEEVCSGCHATGLLGSPVFQSADWTPRKAQGFNTLLDHATQGFNQMPAMGGCSDCTAKEIGFAIKYMIGE